MAKHDDTPAGEPGNAATTRRRTGLFLLTMIALVVLPIVTFWRDRGLPNTLWEYVEFGGLILFVAVVIGWMVQWRASGAVLVDCGPHPNRKLGLIVGWLGLLLAAPDLAPRLMDETTDWTEITKDLSMLPMLGLCFGLALSRRQIRENGLWSYGFLVKWGAVVDHHWRGEGERTLMVTFKKPAGALGRKARFTVPAELKEHVEARLVESRTEPT